jgi:hypothetical protein
MTDHSNIAADLLHEARVQHAKAQRYEARAAYADPNDRKRDIEDADAAYGQRNHCLRQLTAMGVNVPGWHPWTPQFDAETLNCFLTQE